MRRNAHPVKPEPIPRNCQNHALRVKPVLSLQVERHLAPIVLPEHTLYWEPLHAPIALQESIPPKHLVLVLIVQQELIQVWPAVRPAVFVAQAHTLDLVQLLAPNVLRDLILWKEHLHAPSVKPEPTRPMVQQHAVIVRPVLILSTMQQNALVVKQERFPLKLLALVLVVVQVLFPTKPHHFAQRVEMVTIQKQMPDPVLLVLQELMRWLTILLVFLVRREVGLVKVLQSAHSAKPVPTRWKNLNHVQRVMQEAIHRQVWDLAFHVVLGNIRKLAQAAV